MIFRGFFVSEGHAEVRRREKNQVLEARSAIILSTSSSGGHS